MTDLSNNGSGAKAGGAAKPKGARKTAPKTPGARSSAARTSTAKKATMTDETKTTTSSTQGGTSGSAMSAAEERLRSTLQQIETRAEELRRWGMARQEMAREVVEDRPLAVVGVAFGVGLLLGLIASRV